MALGVFPCPIQDQNTFSPFVWEEGWGGRQRRMSVCMCVGGVGEGGDGELS